MGNAGDQTVCSHVGAEGLNDSNEDLVALPEKNKSVNRIAQHWRTSERIRLIEERFATSLTARKPI